MLLSDRLPRNIQSESEADTLARAAGGIGTEDSASLAREYPNPLVLHLDMGLLAVAG